MVRQRPRRALQATWQVRLARVAVPSVIAGLATTGVVAAATGSTTVPQSSSPTGTASASASPSPTASPRAAEREQPTSRNASRNRPALTAAAKPAKPAKPKLGALPTVKLPSLRVVDTEYTRVALNVREQADADSDLITVLKSGSKVSVTKTVRGPWQLVAYRGDGGWVKKQYLVESKPQPKPRPKRQAAVSSRSSAASSGGSTRACPGGSSVESGLTPDAIRLHRALCARFPGVTSYGGVRADSLPDHPSGRALDAMVSSSGLGQQIANWVRANASRLGVSEVIFAQRIWTVQRGGEGWRSMSDRGSPSANHYDHVHITVYGNSGG